ncbi:N-acetylmuramoyl-L-alanine amidase [Natranaerofaba carboxydovora]|uniref:N-acetylmuramoyl-L-alanine amidase n=1 Tax=Natranaerofaba carboxydovora TaxID=2742683 RepID=UPI001F144091|nr:N-acetylmuramoyl-L-alanine amidase [Natranaerofaba carboxydovora]UMZ75430.1 Germination-specific N-acetylmuramoyl-L-alanine amidase [Natranaerofaba carboxydovora]
MKAKFAVIKLTKKFIFKILIVLFILILIVAAWFFNNLYMFNIFSSPELYTNLDNKVVGIDPGHGGYDPGFFKGEVRECDVVLDISLKLRRLLEQGGAQVVMTREEDSDMWDYYDDNNNNNTHPDLGSRARLMEEHDVDLFVSVHANSIPSSVWSGAQTFYQEGDEESEILAHNIQDQLIETLKNTDRTPLSADYYILNNTAAPGVIVEVGFLSNPTERELLVNDEYQERVAWAMYLGLIEFMSQY